MRKVDRGFTVDAVINDINSGEAVDSLETTRTEFPSGMTGTETFDTGSWAVASQLQGQED